MKPQAQIGIRQFQIIVILFTIGTTILITPAGLAAELKQDAWIAPIAALVPGLLLALLYNRIGQISPGLTLVELCEELLGKWIGKIVSFLFLSFFFLAATMVLFDVGRFITTVIMVETPMLFVNSLFAVMLIYGIRSGFDTLVRMVELFFPWFVILLVLMFVFVSPQIDLKNAQPFFEVKMNKLLSSSLSVMSFSFMPLVVFLMIAPNGLKSPERASRSFVIAVLIGGIISIAIVALTTMVLGSGITSLQEYPVYHLTQKISVGRFFERFEVVAAFMWLITSFVKLSVYFYAAVSGFVHIGRLTSERSILLPMGFLLVIISVSIFPNSVHAHQFDSADWIAWVFSIGVILPILLLMAKLGKGKVVKK